MVISLWAITNFRICSRLFPILESRFSDVGCSAWICLIDFRRGLVRIDLFRCLSKRLLLRFQLGQPDLENFRRRKIDQFRLAQHPLVFFLSDGEIRRRLGESIAFEPCRVIRQGRDSATIRLREIGPGLFVFQVGYRFDEIFAQEIGRAFSDLNGELDVRFREHLARGSSWPQS